MALALLDNLTDYSYTVPYYDYYDQIKYDTYPLEEFVKYEVKINPFDFPKFDGPFSRTSNSKNEEDLLDCFLDAKRNDRLHTFTCMCLDPSFSIRDDEYEIPIPPACLATPSYRRKYPYGSSETLSSIKQLIFVKDTLPGINISPNDWLLLFRKFNPIRNSRLMTRTEYVCRCIHIIIKLVEFGFSANDAFNMVCNNSEIIGNYSPLYQNGHYPSDGYCDKFCKLTGSDKIVDFYDLANTSKILAPDPWESNQYALNSVQREKHYSIFLPFCYIASGNILEDPKLNTISFMHRCNSTDFCRITYSVGLLAMD